MGQKPYGMIMYNVPKTCPKLYMFIEKNPQNGVFYSKWPQDECGEEDKVCDEDENVSESEPSPHCLRPATFEHLSIWTFEHLNIWAFEHLSIWAFEYLNIWTIEYCLHPVTINWSFSIRLQPKTPNQTVCSYLPFLCEQL